MKKKSSIQIGNQTAFSATALLDPFEYALEKGFHAFEFFPDKKDSGEGWEVCDIDPVTRKKIKKKAAESEMTLSVHAPWQSNPFKKGFSRAIKKHISFARDIGATTLVIHLYNDEGIEEFIQAITPLIMNTRGTKMKIAIENTPLTSPDDFNFLFALFHEMTGLPTGHVGMCLDIGHANLCSATHNDYLRFMDHLDREVPLVHVHMHENYGDMDSHLTLFTGPSSRNSEGICGVITRLMERGFSGSIIFEQWPDPSELLISAHDTVSQIIEECERARRSRKKKRKAGK